MDSENKPSADSGAAPAEEPLTWRQQQQLDKRELAIALVPEKILCLMCGTPSAIFQEIKVPNGKAQVVRLAKTMRRVTGRSMKPAEYVHEDPCLPEFARRMAEIIAEAQMKKTLAQDNTNEAGK